MLIYSGSRITVILKKRDRGDPHSELVGLLILEGLLTSRKFLHFRARNGKRIFSISIAQRIEDATPKEMKRLNPVTAVVLKIP